MRPSPAVTALILAASMAESIPEPVRRMSSLLNGDPLEMLKEAPPRKPYMPTEADRAAQEAAQLKRERKAAKRLKATR